MKDYIFSDSVMLESCNIKKGTEIHFFRNSRRLPDGRRMAFRDIVIAFGDVDLEDVFGGPFGPAPFFTAKDGTFKTVANVMVLEVRVNCMLAFQSPLWLMTTNNESVFLGTLHRPFDVYEDNDVYARVTAYEDIKLPGNCRKITFATKGLSVEVKA